MTHTENLIIGAGPAGLQLAHALADVGLDYLVVERAAAPGAFFAQYPRHRKLISINKVYTGFDDREKNLRWDWNSLLDAEGPRMSEYSPRYFPSPDDLRRYLADFAERHQLRIRYQTPVIQVRRDPAGAGFVVETEAGPIHAARVIVATGLWRERTPAIPGIEHAEAYGAVSIDPNDFRGQRVLVIGKGNSAFETADNLMETTAALHMLSPTPIRLAWKTHFVGHLRAVNNNLLDSYQLKSQNTILDAEIERIVKTDTGLRVDIRYTHARDQRISLAVDRVISCAGFCFDASPFAADCRPETILDGKLPAMTSAWESVNVPGMYFAGALMQSRDYHRTFSAFIHGFRYNVVALAHILARRVRGTEWPSRPMRREPGELLAAVLARVDRSSALFQQPGFLADVIELDPEGARYREAVPCEWLWDEGGGRERTVMTVTMEYGRNEHADPFNVPRVPDDGRESFFIHPVLRTYVRGELVAEHHVPEDLENDWSAAMYVEPLNRFLRDELAAR